MPSRFNKEIICRIVSFENETKSVIDEKWKIILVFVQYVTKDQSPRARYVLILCCFSPTTDFYLKVAFFNNVDDYISYRSLVSSAARLSTYSIGS